MPEFECRLYLHRHLVVTADSSIEALTKALNQESAALGVSRDTWDSTEVARLPLPVPGDQPGNDDLTEAEVMLLIDALNGVDWAPDLLVAEVGVALGEEWQDGQPGRLAKKWGVDGSKLLGKLERWGTARRVQLRERMEAYWGPSGNVTDAGARLREVGLVKG